MVHCLREDLKPVDRSAKKKKKRRRASMLSEEKHFRIWYAKS